LKKDDVIEVKIEDMGVDGEGIGKADGITLFIKDAVIGDVVQAKIMKMKKSYGYARLLEVLTPSPYRVEPKCPVSRPCGGCQLQALSYDKQLEFKENKVRNNLKRIGGFTDIPMEPIAGMKEPYHYRNKAQFPIGRDKEGKLTAGFYAARTHSLIPVDECYLGAKINEPILGKILQIMEQEHIEPYDEKTHTGLVRHILIRFGFTTKEIMVCFILNGKKLPKQEKFIAALTEIPGMTSISVNRNEKDTNVIMGEKTITIWGSDYITDYIGDIKYQISPQSFYQVNPAQTKVLYEKALEYAGLTGTETVWDLYCGIGTISLFLAQKAKKVFGVEIVPQAIADAKKNAALNDITNVDFFVGKAEEVYPSYVSEHKEEAKAEVIVVDPPRKGCEESLLSTIVSMAPERIVYVSCDSATLARDLKYLCGHGYELKRVQAVDQFCQTGHCETVVLLSKGAKDPVDLCSARTEVERRMVDSRKVKVGFSLEDMDLSEFKGKATYEQIKAYVLEQTGLKVSSLYIAQIKKKCGLDVGENFNLAKSENTRQPQCTTEKEEAIMQAFSHFGIK
jgi:23S rRNA (uracil1939-C5)-methyltransferase